MAEEVNDGMLCYKKGGSALAYSKKADTAGALIYKTVVVQYYFVVDLAPSKVKWVYSKASGTMKPVYEVPVNSWSVSTDGTAWNPLLTARYKSNPVIAGVYGVDSAMNVTLGTDTQVGTHAGYRYNAFVDNTFVYTVKSYKAKNDEFVHEDSITHYASTISASRWNVNDTGDVPLNTFWITLAADGTFTLSYSL